MAYTIQEIASLAGVTTRTLRYYDEIGLLSPASIGGNGYRYYDQDSLLRLQQILFFRELDLSLKEIQYILSRPDFNLLEALEAHRAALQSKVNKLERLIHTVERTIDTIKGESKMSAEDYFDGFDQTQYEAEVRARWGDTPQYAESRRKWASYSVGEIETIKTEGARLAASMTSLDPEASPGDPDVQAAVGEYYAYINKYFYTCDLNFLRGLADMWVADPRFAAHYERIRPGGAQFVRQAVHLYCDQHE